VAEFDIVPCPPIQNLYFVGRNYVEHAEELGNERPTEPLIFTKPLSCVATSGEGIPYPSHSHALHYEGEMVFVLPEHGHFSGKNPKILAGCGIDFTARDIQAGLKKKGWPWFAAKCFRGSAVVSSEFTSIPVEFLPHLSIETWINGEKRQHGRYTDKIFSVPVLAGSLEKLVNIGTHDVLFTGTPAGVGKVVPGDKIEVRLLIENRVLMQTTCEVMNGHS